MKVDLDIFLFEKTNMNFRECVKKLIEMDDPDSQMRCHRDDVAYIVMYYDGFLDVSVHRKMEEPEFVMDASKADLLCDLLMTNPDVWWIE